MAVVMVVFTLCVLGGLLVMLVAGGMALHDAVARLSSKHEEPSHVPPHGVLSTSERHHRMAARFERIEDLALGWKNRERATRPTQPPAAPARVIDVRASRDESVDSAGSARATRPSRAEANAAAQGRVVTTGRQGR